MRIDDLIKDAVDELGRNLPPRSHLADITLRASRRRRRTARVAAAGGTALAVGGVTMATVAAWPTDPGVPAGPAASTTAAAPDLLQRTVRIDIDRLPKGTPPAVPWIRDGAIHDGDRTVPFAGRFEDVRRLRAVAGGYAVLVRHPGSDGTESNELFLVRADGTRTSLGRGMHGLGVSADGRRIAFATSGEDTTTLTVADATSGQRIAEQTVGDRKLIRGKVIGFLDDHRVVIDDVFHGPAQNYVWDSSARSVSVWGKYEMISGLSASGNLAAFPAEQFIEVTRASTGQVLWRTRVPELTFRGFSPGDRHVALDTLVPRPNPSKKTFNEDYRRATKQFRILDAATGKQLLEINVQHPDVPRFVWESDRSVVFEAFKGSRTALIRCTLDGRCELATAPASDAGTVDDR